MIDVGPATIDDVVPAFLRAERDSINENLSLKCWYIRL